LASYNIWNEIIVQRYFLVRNCVGSYTKQKKLGRLIMLLDFLYLWYCT